MPQIINTNIASLNAQRNLDKSQSSNQQALQRLSSGLRINSAKDDAAGLAISTRFTSQIKGLNVAVRNAGDGIALAQTAEGALGSMNDSLQRIRELAVQSSNATNSDVDRDALQSEVDQLVAEITRTSEETDFNGRKLLDGSFSASFQVGANAGQTIDVTIGQLTADKLGVGTSNGVSAQGSDKGLQNGDLSINGIAIDPSKSGSDTASTTNQAASAISKVDTINAKSDQTGVTAKVNTNVASGAEMTAGTALTGTVTLNGVDIDVATGGLDTSADRDSVISSINAKADQTGVTARDGGDAGGVILEAADGRNIDVSFGGGFDTGGTSGVDATESAAASASTGLSSGTSYGGYTLTSNDGSDIVIAGGAGTGTGDISNSGLSAGTFSGRESAITSKATDTAIMTAETASTFTSGNMGITGATTINATNNSFELSINGSDFQTLTLLTTEDVGAAGGAGDYDDVEQLAAQMTAAIAADTNFQDASNNPLITVSGDNATGKLTFTTADKGADSSVIARTGAGSLAVTTGISDQTDGVDGSAAMKRDRIDFNFDGNNAFAADGNFTITLAGGIGASAALAVTPVVAGTGPTADEMVTALNTAIAGDATIAGNVQAVASDDGSSVYLESLDTSVTGISIVATGTNSLVQESVQQLANGDSVITDVAAFNGGLGGVTSEVQIDVDGAGVQTLDLATTTTTYPPTNVQELADAINDVAINSLAGAGITASVVGDQVVISSNKADGTGTVAISDAAAGADNVGGAAVAITSSDEADFTQAGAGASVTTGSFNVSDGTDGNAEGTFLSADADPSGSVYSAQASPLVITAGENDTFTISVDGGADTNITIPPSSPTQTYNTLADLATAISGATAGVTVTVDAEDSSKLKFTSDNATPSAGSIELKNGASGVTANTDGGFAISGGQVAGVLVTQDIEPNVLKTGDLTINGTAISGADAKDDTASDTNALTSDGAASGISVAAAINKSTAETGVTATVNATSVTGGGDNSAAAIATTSSVVGDGSKAASGSTGQIYINDVETAAITLTGDESRDRQSAIDVINAVSGQTGVTAEDNGESITLTAADGRNISVAIDNKLADNAGSGTPGPVSTNFGNAVGLDAKKDGIGEGDLAGTDATYVNTAGTTNSTVTLTSASAIEVSNGANGSDELAEAGFSAGTFGGGEDGQFLKDLDISTVEGAASAITAIDNAIGQVASQRADLGAIQNRMESTVSNLQVTSENLNAANSRIQDADFAAETAELQRTNVLQQAGISVLAQANAAGQQVLSLLG